MRSYQTLLALTLATLGTLASASAADAEEVVAVTADGRLITFDTDSPGTLTGNIPLTGIAGDVVAIDVRLSDGVLFAVTSGARLYRIDAATGVGTPVGTSAFSSGLGQFAGMTFEQIDRIRVVNDVNLNMRIDPDDGSLVDGDPAFVGVQRDRQLAYAATDVNARTDPTIVALASDGSTTYGIDATLDLLVTVDPPSAGTLHTVGTLGINTTSLASFDESADVPGTAYAVLTVPGQPVSGLYSLNLATGGVAFRANVGYPANVVAMAMGKVNAGTAIENATLVGLTAGAQLVRFESDAPTVITSRVLVTGLVEGDTLVAIDTRPANGRLYGLSGAGRIYVLDAETGAATLVRTDPLEVAPEGTKFGFEFSPVTGKLRIVSDSGQNFRADADTGAALGGAADSPLAFAAGDENRGATPRVVAAAFDRNLSRSGATSLFVVDAGLGVLARLGTAGPFAESPSAGRLHTIGILGLDTSDVAGLEIVGDSTGFAAVAAPDGFARLYRIDLGNGLASLVDRVGVSEMLRDIAIAPTSRPTAPGTEFTVRSLVIRFDYARPDRDSVSLEGTLPFPSGPLAGRTVTVGVGGFSKTFVLGRRGAGRDDAATSTRRDDDGVSLDERPHDGHLGFSVRLRREDLSDELADEGMGGTADAHRENRTVQVSFTLDADAFSMPVLVEFDAREGRDGFARTVR